jgi:hypothetical protein
MSLLLCADVKSCCEQCCDTIDRNNDRIMVDLGKVTKILEPPEDTDDFSKVKLPDGCCSCDGHLGQPDGPPTKPSSEALKPQLQPSGLAGLGDPAREPEAEMNPQEAEAERRLRLEAARMAEAAAMSTEAEDTEDEATAAARRAQEARDADEARRVAEANEAMEAVERAELLEAQAASMGEGNGSGNLSKLSTIASGGEEADVQAAIAAIDQAGQASDKAKVARFLKANGFSRGVNTRRSHLLRVSYPLHSAVQQKDLESVRLLLEARASPASKNSAGRTPLQLAEKIPEDKGNAQVRLGMITLLGRAELEEGVA